MLKKSTFTPLHLAVINNDLKNVRHFSNKDAFLTAQDHLGFTPLELAQLLGKRECQVLLGCPKIDSIKFQDKDKNVPSELYLESFEVLFGFNYCAFLTFESYQSLEVAIQNCPYVLRSSWLASENYEWTSLYKSELVSGKLASVYIKWISREIGYGLFANEDLLSGSYIGEYTGLVRRLYRSHPDQNGYCFHYPTRFWSFNYYVIDGLGYGNMMRFVNHSDRPNLQPICLVDRGVLHLVLIAKNPIKKGSQLTFDYGQDYWKHRKKILQ